jgi:type IX secretion system PorP/SprF family membrane protein
VRQVFTIIPLLVFYVNVSAQDPQFSQFYAAKLLLGPSFAGTTAGSRITMNFRDQWPQIPKEFISMSLGYDHYFPGSKSGIGLVLMEDRAGQGTLRSTSFTLQYSYHFDISKKWQVRPGLQLSYVSRSVDFNKMIFGDQLTFTNPRPISIENLNKERRGFLDFGTSVMAFSNKMWFGASVHHLPTPNETLTSSKGEIPIKYSFYGGAKIIEIQRLLLYESESFSFTYLYKSQGEFDQLDVGFYWSREPIEMGIWYRGLPGIKQLYDYTNQDALVVKLGYFAENFSIGYSYDFTISSMRTSSGGAHEISFIFTFNQYQGPKKRKFRTIPCPKF